MTPEERDLLINTAHLTAKLLNDAGYVADARDICDQIKAIQTVEERLPHTAAIKDLDK